MANPGSDRRDSRGWASPGISLLLASCALTATAAYLGVQWLRVPFAGIPAGLWVIGLVQALGWARTRSRDESASLRWIAWDQAMGRVIGRILALGWEVLRVVSGSLRVPTAWFRELEDRVSSRMDRVLSHQVPLRIGIDAGAELRTAITTQASQVPVEWVGLPPGAEDEATLRRHKLDALVRASGEGDTRPVRIVTREHSERESAWYDWTTARPLTYASVFPVRVDVSRVTLDDVDPADADQVFLIGAMARAAAALSRSPARLRLSDRLVGRLPSAGGEAGVRTPTGLIDRAMVELTEHFTASKSARSGAARAAARASSAWLASTEAWLDITLRRRGVEAAMSAVGGECEVLLRAAAVRLASFEDDAAFEALREAERLIRSGSHQQIGEHLAFLQAELELGSPNPLRLGRLAAGIALVCASSDADRVAFIRGDIMDDVRHSAWLVGRDQDRALLAEVFKLMGADQVRQGAWELRDAA